MFGIKKQTAHYQQLADQLNFHVNGMKAIRKLPDLYKAWGITRIATKMMIFEGDSTNIYEPVIDITERLFAVNEKRLIERIEKYLS